jgi:hypothetical protein
MIHGIVRSTFQKLPLCPNNQPVRRNLLHQRTSGGYKNSYTNRSVYDQKTHLLWISIWAGGRNGCLGCMDCWKQTPMYKPSLHYNIQHKHFQIPGVITIRTGIIQSMISKDFLIDTRFASSFLDATQSRLQRFKKNNGKMIIVSWLE